GLPFLQSPLVTEKKVLEFIEGNKESLNIKKQRTRLPRWSFIFLPILATTPIFPYYIDIFPKHP
ncbi:MAG: hypothetical protein AAB870_02955, partial [Patescibacteria group bacterium]